MKPYLLPEEASRIETLLNQLAFKLKINTEELRTIQTDFKNLIQQSKDCSIEEILNKYFDSFATQMHSLLDLKLSPGIQFGIKNEFFTFIGFGGTYSSNGIQKEVTENTYFSLDSISKLLTSVLITREVLEGNLSFDTPILDINPNFSLNSSIQSILNFTAMIQTEQRIDDLDKEETITILKKCKEDLEKKKKYKHYYEYNDIGYMILRLSLENFLTKLDKILQKIDQTNLTYQNYNNPNSITGGKRMEEFITPDRKGRTILFPGHTGLYGNISGLFQLFWEIFATDHLLKDTERKILFKQPYKDPKVYDINGNQAIGKNNSLQYMAKIAGIYRKPKGIIDPHYNKMASCDMSQLTTDDAIASTGTCGSWGMYDQLHQKNYFGSYTAGLLTNPYTFVHTGKYKDTIQPIPNTPLSVNSNGVILGYQTFLNPYKEIITHYALLLELITEYIKEFDETSLQKATKKYLKKI